MRHRLHHLPRIPLPRIPHHAPIRLTSTTSAISSSLRKSMRLLPHPVVILTTALSPTAPGRGITLSTLTCLSLQPYPLLTFNIKTPSTCSAAMHSSGRFTIHILSSLPHAAHLANAFAQLAAAGPEGKRDPWAEVRGRVEREGDSGVPVLGWRDGVALRFVCEKREVVEVEDHEIWVAKVLRVEEGKERGGFGLMYADRRFRSVGKEVVPEFGEGADDGSEGP